MHSLSIFQGYLKMSIRKLFATFILAIVFYGVCRAEVWRLGDSGDWQTVKEDEQSRYLLAVSEIKELISSKPFVPSRNLRI